MDEKELFLKKFEDKLKQKLDPKALESLKGNLGDEDLESNEYLEFRLESLPKSIGYYEKICNFSEKALNLKADEKTSTEIEKHLFAAHLNCTPGGVISASILFSILLVMLGIGIFLFSSTIGIGILIIGVVVYFAMQSLPKLLERRFRAKANDEVIIAIFYLVAFMRFNSNLELATAFAANYLNGPLSLDFKRILWELENAKHPNIKVAFDKYLETWRDENLEFLEAIYLIESSLFESEDARRITLLDKSLDIILQGSYERMLHFAQELRGKVSTFNMIGVVLPILGLIILPLAASFGDPRNTWEVVFLLYNIIFPFGVAYFGFLIIFNRPAGVSSMKIPNIRGLSRLQKVEIKISKEKSIYVSPKIPAITTFILFLLIGLFPLIIHNFGLETNINSLTNDIFGTNSAFSPFQEYKTLDPGNGGSYQYGPYGVFPGVLSIFIPLAFAFAIGSYLRNKYKNLIHIRDKTKRLETEFASATFQLGNRINEGISAELAFGAVADTMRKTETGEFFSAIDSNIKFSGMSVEKAIFDSEKGAVNQYPSDLIISSMKIFIKANEKGPEIAAKTLIDLSKYLSEIHMSKERLKDLLAESLGSMKGQANFLAPLISGVVISIVSLVTLIMGSLSKATAEISASSTTGDIGSFLGESIPTFLFQSVVGIYITMLIAILMYMVVNLENGEDPIQLKYSIGDKMIKGMTKYAIIVALGIIGFSFVGNSVLGSIV